MPALFYALLVWVLGSALARVLLGAGLTVLTFNWLDEFVIEALDAVTAQLSGTPGLDIMLLAGVGEALSIIGSALVARATIEVARIYIGRA
jgi:Protein of unknown function (DUF2523).